jgi:hypothetical protein
VDSSGVDAGARGQPGAFHSLQVNDQTYDVDTYYTAQSNWYADEIDIAFQMDGNYEQQPYNVWLDNVTLNAQ